MKLLSKEQIEQIPDLYSTEGQGTNSKVYAHIYNPMGKGDWLITEKEIQPDGDVLLYGLVLLLEREWGYVMLSELENIKLPFGLELELDNDFSGTVRDYAGPDSWELEEQLDEIL